MYTEDEARALLAREMPRYCAALLDGTALRRLTNVEAIYVISNGSAWDEVLRSAFTAQLTSQDAIATLATLLVPPGHGGNRSAFNTMFDADAVFDQIERLQPIDQWPFDPWVKASVQRLHSILTTAPEVTEEVRAQR